MRAFARLFNVFLFSLSVTSQAAKLGLCERLTAGFGDIQRDTGSFATLAKKTSTQDKYAIIRRLYDYAAAVGSPDLRTHFEFVAAIASGEIHRYKKDLKFADASLASYVGEEIDQVLRDYRVTKEEIAKLENQPGINFLKRILRNYLISAIVTAPFYMKNSEIAGYVAFMCLGLSTAMPILEGINLDRGRNREHSFLNQAQAIMQETAVADKAGPLLYLGRRLGPNGTELLLSREPDGRLRLDVVRWRYREHVDP